jgi:hypothetical protein
VRRITASRGKSVRRAGQGIGNPGVSSGAKLLLIMLFSILKISRKVDGFPPCTSIKIPPANTCMVFRHNAIETDMNSIQYNFRFQRKTSQQVVEPVYG